MDISVLFGGPQGSGVQSVAETFAKAMVRAGHHVFSELAYASNIQGKHQYSRVRVADHPVASSREQCGLVVALDLETLTGDEGLLHYPTHRGHVHQARGGHVIYDAKLTGWTERLKDPLEATLLGVPYDDIVSAAIEQSGIATKNPQILRNTAMLGAAFAVLDFDVERAVAAVHETFAGKRSDLTALNEAVVRTAYAHIASTGSSGAVARVEAVAAPRRLFIKGTQASALAKLAAGCALQTYYPIAPATDESTYLEKAAKEHNILVVQCEDEAASACMLVGAAHTGVRASTATSGPGFALMCEAIGVAAEMEAHGIVVTLYQRSGPSTGMPTRYEQADLLWALHPAQGEFPHIVVASGDAAELYELTYLAFNWADRYGLPVVVLTDKHQASSGLTIDALPALAEPIDRGNIVTEVGAGERYLRYAGTEGASPRTLPGTPGGIFWTTSDEHDPEGHITEGVDLRMTMMAKRMGKLETALRDIPRDAQVAVYGPEDAKDTVIFWGGSKGVVLDVLAARVREGRTPFRALQVKLMRPFPASAVREELFREVAGKGTVTYIAVEENYTGQLEEIMALHTGVGAMGSIRKADGRPLKVEELDRALDLVLGKNTSAGTGRIEAGGVIRVVSDD